MTEEVNVGMGAQAPKKGMSKGCLVAIIVAGALLVLCVLIVVFAIVYKKDVVSYGTSMTLNSTKKMLAENNEDNIDTVYYNKLVDDFNVVLYNDTITLDEVADSLRFIEISKVFSFAQTLVADKKIDSSEVVQLAEILYTKYPEIAPVIEQIDINDSTQTDSL